MSKEMMKETVTVPVSLLEDLKERLAVLEAERDAGRRQKEYLAAQPPETQILDARQEAYQKWVMLSTEQKSQLRADAEFGTSEPRWRVKIVPTADEEGRVNKNSYTEHPALLISANSREEAQGRYELLCKTRIKDQSAAHFEATREHAPALAS